jgi:beta-glucanase (GH16 family)
MRNLLIILLCINAVAGNRIYAQDHSLKTAGDLIWSDEFDGTGVPNPAKWERQEYNRRNNDTGPDGWWSNEDSYLDGNGNLVIRVRKIADKNNDGDTCDFSVGMVRSKGRFEHLYGKYEIRCKLPTQPGWWVAFWMMQGNVGSVGNGGVDGTEVDIMEAFGWTDLINSAFHWDGYGSAHKSTGRQFRPAGIREGFHTYTLEWYPEMYVFLIDGEETFRSIGGGVCNRNGYIKVTGEISTESWAINSYWANDPADAVYPDSFIVDYVRVYELGPYVPPVGTEELKTSGGISVWPNPAGNQLNLRWDPAQFVGEPGVTILNTTGQVIRSFGKVGNNSSLQLNDFDRGVYFISIQGDDGRQFVRFVKR